jgi:hypothetical protein
MPHSTRASTRIVPDNYPPFGVDILYRQYLQERFRSSCHYLSRGRTIAFSHGGVTVELAFRGEVSELEDEAHAPLGIHR